MKTVIASSMTTLLPADAAWLIDDQRVALVRRRDGSLTTTIRRAEAHPRVRCGMLGLIRLSRHEDNRQGFPGYLRDAGLESADELFAATVTFVAVHAREFCGVREVQLHDAVIDPRDTTVEHGKPRRTGDRFEFVENLDPSRFEGC